LRIAIDCRFWGTKNTGLGRYTQNLVENLLKIDKKNDYILLVDPKNNLTIGQSSPGGNAEDPWQSRDNLTIAPVNVSHYSLKEQLLLPKILKKVHPDLVHFPHFNVPIFCHYPFVVTIHDLIKHYFQGTETTTRQALIYYFKYWGYKQVFFQAVTKAKKIIVPSQFVKKQILKFYSLPADKIQVVYEGVSMKQTYNLQPTTYNLKNYFLYVGNAYPHKNLDTLILAMKKLNSSSYPLHPTPYTLKIVSPRDVFYSRLQGTIKRFQAEKFVKLVGHVTDERLKKLYNQALAFISPSLMEGFGLPGLEAMANACPVICSNIATFKEIYAQAVTYFNPENIDDIVDKIKRVINFSPQQRQGIVYKGKYQAAKYSWQKCSQQTLKVYNSL
jgi:glycosyltransferase involved in cell wall biosynthesis